MRCAHGLYETAEVEDALALAKEKAEKRKADAEAKADGTKPEAKEEEEPDPKVRIVEQHHIASLPEVIDIDHQE